MPKKNIAKEFNLVKYLLPIIKQASNSSLVLFMFMVPIVIVIKIAQELNIINYLVYPFIPLMKILGLPDIYALVWLSGILNTNYTSFYLILVFFQETPLTYAQITTLAMVCLVCHNIITESAISHKLRVNAFWSAGIRFLSAMFLGYIINITLQKLNIMQDIVSNVILHETNTIIPTFMDYIKDGTFAIQKSTWLYSMLGWFFSQLKMLLLILFIINVVFLGVQILKDLNIVKRVNKFFQIFFNILRISKNNSFITLVAYIIGLSYAWGLLKAELRGSTSFRKDQAVQIVTYLSLAHGVIEDSIIFILLGADAWIIIILRTAYALLFGYILGRLILPNLPYQFKTKYLYTKG